MRFSYFRFAWQKVAILIVLFAAPLMAIAQNARVTGSVTDPAGLAIPGAAVMVQNEATNVRHETTSSSTGDFNVPGLEPGKYTVRAEKSGFESLSRTGVTLFIATETRVDLRLSVGQQTQTVTVTGEASALQTDNAQLSTTVTRKEYDELPLVQQGRIRSPTAFVYLAPSVQGNYSATGAENIAATNYISVNGSQMKQTEFYLSGLSAGQMANVGSYNESAPPVDAVQEFKMMTTLLPADYGHTGAAAGIFAIRNGTNTWHGSVYEYLRNNVLDAQPWGTITPLFTRQNEFGATLGGPVRLGHLYDGRNRSFFFFSYGGSRKSGVDSLKTTQIPTPAKIDGDFSGGPTIYDPATTRLNAAGTGYIRDPFPNNKIPASRIDPLAAKIAAFYPAPNAPGTQNYQSFIGERLLNPDVYTARVDHHINDAQHLFFTFIQTRIPRLKPEGSGLPQPLSTVYNQFLRASTVRINHDWTINSRMLNSLSIGYYRIFAQLQPGGTEFALPGQISPNRPSLTFTNGYASISTDNGQKTAEHQYLASDVFYLSKGSHNFRIGGEFRRVHLNLLIPNPGTNTAALSNLETANPNSTSNTGDAFASFLLGQVDSGSLTAPSVTAVRYSYGGAFLQDDWKVSSRLTLNLGIRWEIETIPFEADNKSSLIDLSLPNVGAGNRPGALAFAGSGVGRTGRSTFASTRYVGFGPRMGLSYAVAPNLLFRAGAGLYYADLGWSSTSGVDNYGYVAAATYSSPNRGVTPAFTFATGFPGAPSLQPSISPTLLNGQSGDYMDKSVGYMPYIEQWSGNLQYSPSPTWVLEAAYVGTSSHRQLDPQFTNINQLDPKYLALGSLLTVPASSAAAQAAGISLPYTGFTGTVAQALRAYPQYLTLTSVAAKSAYSNYNALQLIATKHVGRGLHLAANYTYAKNMGINSPSWMDGTVDNVLQNAYDPSEEYAISPIDVRHAVVISYTYDLPFGKGRKFLSQGRLADALTGGWKLSAIQRYQSGFPLPIKTANALPIFNRILRPNEVPGVDRSTHLSADQFKPGSSRIINPAAFSQPTAYTFGNAKPQYSDIRSFPIYNEDFAVMKDTRITERLTWTLGANFFNGFNRHRFTSFDTTWSDAGFGQSTAVSEPRFIQLNTRFTF
jgi:hypothetical protein